MRSIQSSFVLPLSAVKPLESLRAYRDFCLSETRKTVEAPGARVVRREKCFSCGVVLVPHGSVAGLDYDACPECASLFLRLGTEPEQWRALLQRVSDYKNSPNAFHASISASRNENVYRPKVEWIQHTLRIHGLSRPRILEVMTSPGPFTSFLTESDAFQEIVPLIEMMDTTGSPNAPEVAGAAVLLESLDRVLDPAALIRAVAAKVSRGGLVFVTALVSSGFDIAALGLNNLYVYPPDRTNCFSLPGLVKLLQSCGLTPVEVSTPGVLDVEIVRAHVRQDPGLKLSGFEGQVLAADSEKREAFQTFLQENLMSSFARIVARVA